MKRTGVVIGIALIAVSGAVAAWVGVPTTSAQTAAVPAPVRVGFVDIQRVLARSSAGVAAREQLEKEKAAMQRQVDAQRGDIEKLREELEKKGQLLSADARREKQEALERKTRDIRRLLDDLEKELQKKEQTMGQKILRDLEGIFTRVGKEKGYAMIIERRQAGVVYGAPEIDVTEDVIKAFDDEMRKAKK